MPDARPAGAQGPAFPGGGLPGIGAPGRHHGNRFLTLAASFADIRWHPPCHADHWAKYQDRIGPHWQEALQAHYLVYALAGALMGTLVGVLPGFGPSAGTAVLIPLTASLDATGAIITLTAIYYGAMYGGTITSVLINTPGEAASAITCLDGHAMARQGRAGPALAIAAIGSFVGGIVATVALVVAAAPLTALALHFGPPEFFALMVLSLSMVAGLAGASLTKALISAVLGLIVALVGIDPVAGAPRFTFGIPELLDGVSFVPVVMGLFGISEVLLLIERPATTSAAQSVGRLTLSRQDLAASAGPIARGTVIGTLFGFVPGTGAVVPSFMAYVVEKRLAREPQRFGQGAIEGVAAPETANNAYVIAALIPLFTLGIPGSPTIAIIMGAFMMNGLTPGPLLFAQHPQFVWTVIASLFVGNAMLLVLNLPFIPAWVSILRLPRAYLLALILGFCVTGAYSLKGDAFDILVMALSGVVGYAMRKLDVPLAPLTLTLILGPMMEQGLRLSLELSRGSFLVFVTRPISATLLVLAVAIVVLTATRAAMALREESQV